MNLPPTPTKEEKVSFNESIREEKVNSSRVIVTLGALLIVIYTLLDSFGLPKDTLNVIYPVRGTILIILTTLFVLTFNEPFFNKHYVKFLMIGYLCSGVMVTIGVYVSQLGDYSYDLYFAALIILVITSFSWSYLPIKSSIFMCFIFISAFVIIKVFLHQDTEGTRPLTLAAKVFFLTFVGIVAAIAQYIRDNLIYRNLRLQKKLKEFAIEKTKEAEEQERLANLDVLTGIPNRRSITKSLNIALKEADQTNSLLILIFMDLNGFKSINDTYGHDSGDKVLEVTAKRLERTIREGDYLARLGGDEFLVGIKANHFSTKFIDALSKKIKNSISSPIAFNSQKLQVGVSIGIATYPNDASTVEELIKVSDKKMYMDKKEHKRIRDLTKYSQH